MTRTRIAAYLAGALDPDEEQTITARIASDPRLAARVERVRRNTSEDPMPVTLSRAQLPTFAHDLVVAEIARRWEAREGAPANPKAGPWRLSELCRSVGCPMPTGALKPITDALGVALGDHHLLHTRPVHDVTPLAQGGPGRLDATDADLTVIDVAALTQEARRQYGLT